MSISASLVKELRERTGAGMMECKKALVATDGDIEQAIEQMRKSGAAKADKKAGRIAAEGGIFIQHDEVSGQLAMLEINCETDFVARDDNFKQFAEQVLLQVANTGETDVAKLSELNLEGDNSVEAVRKELIAKIGENITIRRAAVLAAEGATLAHYRHGERIGVLVKVAGSDINLAKDIAMHIAASKPVVVNPDDVPADLISKEKEIFSAQAAESGKPANIVEKMVEGRIKKFVNEVCLLGQPFVKDPSQTVADLLKAAGASVVSFVRYEVGEGIEKAEDDFVGEVMAQARGDA